MPMIPMDYSDPSNLALGAPNVSYATPTNYGPALTSAGGGFSAMAQWIAAQRSAELLRANASIATAQAHSENQAGAEQANLYRQHLNQTVGQQIARTGGSGLAASGSPLRAIETTEQLGAQDISQIQVNAARKAWGYQVQEAGDMYRASVASRSGGLNTVGSLITSGARAYSQWSTVDG